MLYLAVCTNFINYFFFSIFSKNYYYNLSRFQYSLDVLVASRRNVPRLKDLNPEEIIDFFMTVCKCQRLLEEYYNTTSSTVTVQDGCDAGQTVKVYSIMNI